MKDGDLVVTPDCEDPNSAELTIDLKRRGGHAVSYGLTAGVLSVGKSKNAGGQSMKSGDIVCLISENKLGLIINTVEIATDDPLDTMFPYHVLFADHLDDWFGENSLELVNESR